MVYGAYSGLTEIVLYKRAEEQREPGRTVLEKKCVHKLSPGAVYPYFPGDVHSVVALSGPAVVFRFLSDDLNKVQRAYYYLQRNATVMDRSVTPAS